MGRAANTNTAASRRTTRRPRPPDQTLPLRPLSRHSKKHPRRLPPRRSRRQSSRGRREALRAVSFRARGHRGKSEAVDALLSAPDAPRVSAIGTDAMIVVPRPGRERTVNSPSISRSRSRMLGNDSLLDNSMIVYGAGLSDGYAHTHRDLPTLAVTTSRPAIRPSRQSTVVESDAARRRVAQGFSPAEGRHHSYRSARTGSRCAARRAGR